MNKTMKNFMVVLLAVIVFGSTIVIPTQTTQAKAVKTKGDYVAVAAKSMANMQKGYPILKKVKFKKNKFTTYGGFMYYTDYASWTGEKEMKNKKRTFTLSKKCEYLVGSSYYEYVTGMDMENTTKSISKKSFIKKLKNKIKKNKVNGDLVIKVKGKKIVQMYLSTY